MPLKKNIDLMRLLLIYIQIFFKSLTPTEEPDQLLQLQRLLFLFAAAHNIF